MKLKLKWNWGTGIALAYTAFALMIIAFVVNSFSKQIDLVTPEYYAKELVFQKQIEKEKRSRELTEDVSFMMDKDHLNLQFPEEMKTQKISGKVQFFCPVDAKKDISFQIETNPNGQQTIALDQVKTGRYKLQISWEANGLEYYKEGVIVRN
jgi:hypothetical protein